MCKYLPAAAWTVALYAGTMLTAGKAFIPVVAQDATVDQVRAAWFWFDFQHVVLHAAAYAVLAGLLALPAWGKKTRKEFVSLLVVFLSVVLIVGLGQEAIQTAIRWEVRLADSLSDVASNFGGAGFCLGIVSANRWQRHSNTHRTSASLSLPDRL
jgi:hypothetical protein